MASPVQQYTLPLRVLLGNLQDLQSSGLLQTSLTSLSIKGRQIKETYRVELILEKGSVRQCTIFQSNGAVLLQGNEAWEVLQHYAMQRLLWQFFQEKAIGRVMESSPGKAPQSPSSFAPMAPQERYRGVPRPLPAVSSLALQGLSREYRRILVLANGQRTVQQIAALLSLAPEHVHLVFCQCRSWNLVAYEEGENEKER